MKGRPDGRCDSLNCMATCREPVRCKDTLGSTGSASSAGHKSNRMAENLGVKNAKWDKRDGYIVNRNCYNSYFYLSEDPTATPQEKLKLHGGDYTKYLDGGSACHIGLNEYLSKDQYKFLMKQAIKNKTPYYTFNTPNTICNNPDCGHIDKRYLKRCPVCGSEDVDFATRIIGYLTRISKWSLERQQEGATRYYASASTVDMKGDE